MIIYKGYYYFKKSNGIVLKINTYNNWKHGSIGTIGERIYIELNKEDSLEEQVKTVIHELAHLGLEGENFDKIHKIKYDLLAFSDEDIKIIKEVENKINREVENFYYRDPPLVNYIREKLLVNSEPIKI
ncbi:MAG: hypothetical protein AABX77_01785 [Nanoarchaeota archaeon]